MKKNYFNYFFAALAAVSFLPGCSYDELSTYDKSPDVYFTFLRDKDFTNDSTAVAFYYLDATEKEYKLSIPVTVTGMLSNIDRIVSVAVNAVSTAEAGLHFTMANEIKIPAGKETGSLEITIFRSPDLNQNKETKHLQLTLLPNADFGTDFKTETKNGKTYSLIDYRIAISDKLVQPAVWDTHYFGFFGKYSDKKFLLICELNHVSPAIFEDPSSMLNKIAIFSRVLRNYLKEQADAGTPVYEDDGTLMTAGEY